MSKFRKGQSVRLTSSFTTKHTGMPWLGDLIGTYRGQIMSDNPQAYVLWRGHEKPQTVAINHLEKA